MTRPDPKLAALFPFPRRVSPEAAAFAAAEERAMRLCAERDRAMLHPGFRDTAAPAPDADPDDAPAAAFVLAAFVAAFGAGAVVQAFGGWRASLAIGSACAGYAAAWWVWQVLRRGGRT